MRVSDSPDSGFDNRSRSLPAELSRPRPPDLDLVPAQRWVVAQSADGTDPGVAVVSVDVQGSVPENLTVHGYV